MMKRCPLCKEEMDYKEVYDAFEGLLPFKERALYELLHRHELLKQRYLFSSFNLGFESIETI